MFGSNYVGKQQNQTAYIKRFVEGEMPDVWTIRPFESQPSIQPATSLDVVIPLDLYVEGTIYGTVVTPSDARLKYDVDYLPQDLPLMQLRPCTFRYKNDATKQLHYGFIAQEFIGVFPHIVRGNNGLLGIAMEELIPLLVKHVQMLQQEFDRAQKTAKEQKKKFNEEMETLQEENKKQQKYNEAQNQELQELRELKETLKEELKELKKIKEDLQKEWKKHK